MRIRNKNFLGRDNRAANSSDGLHNMTFERDEVDSEVKFLDLRASSCVGINSTRMAVVHPGT